MLLAEYEPSPEEQAYEQGVAEGKRLAYAELLPEITKLEELLKKLKGASS